MTSYSKSLWVCLGLGAAFVCASCGGPSTDATQAQADAQKRVDAGQAGMNKGGKKVSSNAETGAIETTPPGGWAPGYGPGGDKRNGGK